MDPLANTSWIQFCRVRLATAVTCPDVRINSRNQQEQGIEDARSISVAQLAVPVSQVKPSQAQLRDLHTPNLSHQLFPKIQHATPSLPRQEQPSSPEPRSTRTGHPPQLLSGSKPVNSGTRASAKGDAQLARNQPGCHRRPAVGTVGVAWSHSGLREYSPSLPGSERPGLGCTSR